MFFRKKILGEIGEKYAVNYLQKNGYTIIQRNFLVRGGEIDIIAIEHADKSASDTLVFIEVKTRTSCAYGDPFEAIGYYKMKALIRTAQYYKMLHPRLPALMRIDAVLIQVDDTNALKSIELVKNISV